jgi:ADP-ribose pyrophosphatase YjhB (NUDIX family)
MKTKDNAHFHIVLVKGIVVKDGKYLIAQRSLKEVQAPGKWSLPGGKVELRTKEDDLNILEETVKREVKEETSIEIEENPQYLQSISFVRVDKAPVIGTLFLCKWKSGIAKPLEDHDQVAWITIDELKNYDLAKGVENAIRFAHNKSLNK